MKIHIMEEEPYDSIDTAIGPVPIFKSLCGLKEPWGQAYGILEPTCKRCIMIRESRRNKE